MRHATNSHTHCAPCVVQEQYTQVYLECLGVRPSKAAAAVVARHAPLPPSLVKAQLASHGFASNQLHIDAPEPLLTFHVKRPVMSMTTNRRLKAGMQSGRECALAGASSSRDAAASSAGVACGGMAAQRPQQQGQQAGQPDPAALFVRAATQDKATCLNPFTLARSVADGPLHEQRVAEGFALRATGGSRALPSAPQQLLGSPLSQEAVAELLEVGLGLFTLIPLQLMSYACATQRARAGPGWHPTGHGNPVHAVPPPNHCAGVQSHGGGAAGPPGRLWRLPVGLVPGPEWWDAGRGL